MVSSIARGSFGNEPDVVDSQAAPPQQQSHLRPPQLDETMQSASGLVVAELPFDSCGSGIVVDEEGEGDAVPISASAPMAPQVLEITNRLDLSDCSAVIRCNQQQQQLDASTYSISSAERVAINAAADTTGVGDVSKATAARRASATQRLSDFRMSSRRRLSRRPSMHETHDSEPLRKGEFLYYLYSFAVLGTTLRMFFSRFFGEDCENPGYINDFLSPLSEKICVTASGLTMQHGGAMFIDLPANMLGSFFMGLVSSLNPVSGRPGGNLPWLRKDHPLQKHEGIYHAIKVGFCGSLTTFSSWNSQMVVMLDGTGTELGPQIVPALFGYMVGMGMATWSFVLGGRVHEWLCDWSNGIKDSEVDHDDDEDVKPVLTTLDHGDDDDDDVEQPTSWDSEESNIRSRHSFSSNDGRPSSQDRSSRRPKQSRNQKLTNCTVFLHKVVPFFIAVSVLLVYGLVYGLQSFDMGFFRELFACSILTPIGVHMRWKLATLNGRGIGASHKYEWVPWGTLAVNMMAVIISIIFTAIGLKYSHSGNGDHAYVTALVVGMKTGLAGSLSTVSSFAKETVDLATIHPTHAKAYIYSGGTIVVAMFLGLIIYSPIMRSLE